MSIAIKVEHVGKRYRIGPAQQAGVRDALARAAAAPLALFRRASAREPDTVWAVRDLSFEIARGEAVGIIGRNGAGKSTLLKILSRITRPTTGRAMWRGRLTSLLEVGTGFHPDLTGRENIFLNAAILGMSRAQVRQTLDEIVAFAEVEKFLDTPVRHYSSGMYMRLAFAVAAHLEPEILILDEVLAVGDAAFQQKCQSFIERILRGGSTLLLVSHNLHAISTLCTRALYLEGGMLRRDGPAEEVVAEYLDAVAPSDDRAEMRWTDRSDAPGNERLRLHAVRVVSERVLSERSAGGTVDIDSPLRIEVEYWNLADAVQIYTSIHIVEKTGVTVLSSANLPSFNIAADRWYGKRQPAGLYRSICTLPAHLLNETAYAVSVFMVADMSRLEAAAHHVVSFHAAALRPPADHHATVPGVVRPKLAWDTELVEPLA
jgi:lipopolysaccharide transport system ATP-binding protein